MKIDTIVAQPHLAFGETLSGKIYIDGGESEQLIDYIDIELIRRTEEDRPDTDFSITDEVVGKHSIEMVSVIKSKETAMIPFELVPDERWELTGEHSKLVLRTTVHIRNAVDVFDEDEITYG